MKLCRSIVLFTVTALISFLCSCSQQSQPLNSLNQESRAAVPAVNDSNAGDMKKVRIGVSLLAYDNEFISNIKTAMEAEAKALDVELIMSDGQNSAEKQVSQVENFIAKKVDAIILNPVSIDGDQPAVESANMAEIPILTVNTLVANQDKCVTFVGSDAIESGRLEMSYAAQLLKGKGNIVILHGQIGHDAEIGRRKGVQDILDHYPDIKVIYEQSGNWNRNEGEAITENLIELGKPIDAIVSQNDEMALGAVDALEKSRGNKNILVFGIDAIPEALNAISEGKMAGTVFQDAKTQGADAVEVAYKIAKGEKVQKTIYIPYILVTKSNLSKFL